MQKFISQKQLYSNVKNISDEVQQGTTFIVLKYSKPAYKIVPLDEEVSSSKKSYAIQDVDKFIFKNKNKKNKLAISYKEDLYSTAFDDFQDMQFSGDKNLSQDIDNTLYG